MHEELFESIRKFRGRGFKIDWEALAEEFEIDVDDEALFRLAIEDVPDRELARTFDASLPSVRRWKTGRNLPHPLIRHHVFAYLAKRES